MGKGDDIMITAKAKRLKKENPNCDIVVGSNGTEEWSRIYENNPNITKLKDVKRKIIWCETKPRPYIALYTDPIHDANKAKIKFIPQRPKPGELFLTNEEINIADQKLQNLCNIAYIEPNVKGKISANNKDWGFEKWQAIVDAFPDITFIQAGKPGSKILNGVHFFETQIIREALALLSKAEIYLGHEGGMHHASAAFNIPGVVIYGGFTSPQQTGYDIHTIFYIDDPESPCGSQEVCEHCRRCMEQITVEQVMNAVKDII